MVAFIIVCVVILGIYIWRAIDEGFWSFGEGEMKEKYVIYNEGYADATEGVFEFTKEEFLFLNNLFEELNKNSHYGCMPKISIRKQDNSTEKGSV